jgi:hypothetical protein
VATEVWADALFVHPDRGREDRHRGASGHPRRKHERARAEPLPATSLAAYRVARTNRSASIACHPHALGLWIAEVEGAN